MTSIIDNLNFGTIYFRDKAYTPETIWANIDAVAENLSKRFISNSPFVYLYAPNHIKMVYGLFGILKAGRICVLVDPAIGRFELEEMIKDSPPGAIIRPEKSTDTFDCQREIEVKHYQLSPTRIQGVEDVAIMLYTSADDGFAKGAMLTHENILADARAGLECNFSCPDLTTCAIISFHHLFALQTGLIMPSIVSGNALIIDGSQGISPKKIGDQLRSHTISNLFSSPLVYFLLKKLPNINEILPSVGCITSGGYHLPRDLFISYQKDTGRDIREGYGITEASPICAWNRPNDPVKPGSVGRAFTCCEIKVFNDKNAEVPIGEEGEIFVKGANIFKGYFCNEVATKNSLRDGWLRTGDLGTMDADGNVFLKSLKKRMLNVSGNKVYPSELERLMRRNNNVRDVQIFGESDDILGDRVKARVQLRKNTSEEQKLFREWCFANFTRYKVPRDIEFTS